MLALLFPLMVLLFGTPAKAISINGLDLSSGHARSLEPSSFQVVVFLSTLCPCSRSYEGTLNQLARRYQKRSVEFVGVLANGNETSEMGLTYFRERSMAFPVFFDQDQKWLQRFDAYKTPHVFLLSSEDEILYAGPVGDSHDAPRSKENFLSDAIDSVLSGKSPARRERRPLGCTISRKDSR